ncbi:MAG: hypothetical protein LBR17_05750 [Bacteroidales bacterium]|jgi:hypothetical protein|nr:hypothetical protein [Bacteroidales bacterium]
MKKIVLVLALIGFGVCANAQTVVVQQNTDTKNGQTKTDDCAYRIAGICTSEDIGGVEVSKGNFAGSGYYHLKFSNYNSFPVRVIFEYQSNGNFHTGTIILKANEIKQTEDNYYSPHNFKLIVRKMSN